MNQPLISVIIPVYKVEKYIHRCIKSVLNQTYKNFELILVDDGSPDNSGKICDDYALKDNRIKVIHKQNGGVSSARNAGIDAANGEYINFIDSDDWVPVDSLENLIIPILENPDIDLTVGGYELRDRKIKAIVYNEDVIDFNHVSSQKLIEILRHPCMYGPYCKIYKASIIKDNNITYNVNIKWGEDALFVSEYLRYVLKIAISNKNVYYYNRLNVNSATTKFYPDIAIWSIAFIKSFSLLLKEFIKDDTIYSFELAKYAYDKFFYCALCYSVFLNRELAIKSIKESYEILKDFLLEHKDLLLNYKHSESIKAIKKGDFAFVYDKCCIYKKKLLYKELLRKLYFKLVVPIVEKKRDNLRS